MGIGLKQRMDKYKKQGLTDTQAMQRAMDDQATFIAGVRKRDAAARKKKKSSRLKKSIKTLLSGPGHSPAGKRYLRSR